LNLKVLSGLPPAILSLFRSFTMPPEFEIRYNLINDLMHHLDRNGALNLIACDQEQKAFIEALDMPMMLKRMFQWQWASTWADVGTYSMAPVAQIFSGEWFHRLFACGMLSLGSAKNGDNLLLRMHPDRYEMGLLNSTQFAGEDADASPEPYYVKICDSLDELLLRLVENRFLPIDYDSAVELNLLKQGMKAASLSDATNS
jgi:hypothetical protein